MREAHPHWLMRMDTVDGRLTHWCACGWIVSTANDRDGIASGKAQWEEHRDRGIS